MAEVFRKSEPPKLVAEIFGALSLRFRTLNLYYEAGWTDSFCHRRCMHEHPTLIEAAECGMPHGAGWYVFAVERGTPRQLQGDQEETVDRFRFGAMRGATKRQWDALFPGCE